MLKPLRAKGGHKVHWVDTETRTALCGHKPRNTCRMSRAGWTSPESAPITIPCEKCGKKLAGRKVSLDMVMGDVHLDPELNLE